MKYSTAKEEAMSYRIAIEVKEIIRRGNGDMFPLCPRCRSSLEREYMSYCNVCGQHLGWKKFSDAKITKMPANPHKY